MLHRFHGFYRGEGDGIDFINNAENWEDFGGYLKWKDSWDEMYKEEWVNSLADNLFCTGCGLKPHTKTKVFCPEETYQVCSQEYCNFYYDNEKVNAIVKKENEYTGTFDVYKQVCIDMVNILCHFKIVLVNKQSYIAMFW